QRELAKERVVDAVDLELGLRLLAPGERAGRDLRAEESARLLAEALEAVRGQARADGLAVAAEVPEGVAQPGHQRMERHARSAPSRPAHPVPLHAEEENRAPIFPRQPGGRDPEHAAVPAGVRLEDERGPLRALVPLDPLARLGHDAALERLAPGVAQ